jgi:hypothetical protein
VVVVAEPTTQQLNKQAVLAVVESVVAQVV